MVMVSGKMVSNRVNVTPGKNVPKSHGGQLEMATGLVLVAPDVSALVVSNVTITILSSLSFHVSQLHKTPTRSDVITSMSLLRMVGWSVTRTTHPSIA